MSDQAQLQFDSLLKANRKTSNHLEWIGFKGFLKGELKQERIWELQFYADKRQYRVLGIFGAVRKQVVLLIGCYHKGRIYKPSNALTTASQRAKSVRQGYATIEERQITIDF
ncbi:MAG TPA: hypothetical protein VGL91_16000 [Acidobacteriota bacterium]